VLLAFGALLTAMGSSSIRQGYLWLEWRNIRTNFDVMPALYLELLGLILLFIGAIPWKPLRRLLSRFPRDSKETRNKRTSRQDMKS
jgi:hypothetical protein